MTEAYQTVRVVSWRSGLSAHVIRIWERRYFARYFNWYDTEHYHSGIDHVTPQQAHRDLRNIPTWVGRTFPAWARACPPQP